MTGMGSLKNLMHARQTLGNYFKLKVATEIHVTKCNLWSIIFDWIPDSFPPTKWVGKDIFKGIGEISHMDFIIDSTIVTC